MGRTREQVIKDLDRALKDAGLSMRRASLKLDLNHSYLSQFMRETDYSPDVLPEDVRQALARLLGIDENFLRIHTSSGDIVKDSDIYSRQTRRVGTITHSGRTTEMRVDRLIEELGRIKERLDRLESGLQAEQPTSGRGKKPRPL